MKTLFRQLLTAPKSPRATIHRSTQTILSCPIPHRRPGATALRPGDALRRLLVTALLAAHGTDVMQAASFSSFGYEREGLNDATATAVSDDGTEVAGYTSVFGSEALRFTVGGTAVGLGSGSRAYGISGDGRVVVGQANSDGGAFGVSAFRWSEASGRVALGSLPGKNYHVAWGASVDGSVIVGSGDVNASELETEPFRWTAATGMESLGFLPGDSVGEALAVSRNGSVVVGYSGRSPIDGDGRLQAFLHGPAGTMQALGFLPDHVESIARAVSGDGSVIVGHSLAVSGRSEAFRWTEATGMRGLGRLPGFAESSALAVSADGSIVVGEASSSAPSFETAIFVWDTANGMRNLMEVLPADVRLSLAGWNLHTVNGLSGDGKTIVGAGRSPAGNRQGWLIRLDEVGSQPTLSVQALGDSIVVAWPQSPAGYALFAAASPSALTWSEVVAQPTASAGRWVVEVKTDDAARFFTLRKL